MGKSNIISCWGVFWGAADAQRRLRLYETGTKEVEALHTKHSTVHFIARLHLGTGGAGRVFQFAEHEIRLELFLCVFVCVCIEIYAVLEYRWLVYKWICLS